MHYPSKLFILPLFLFVICHCAVVEQPVSVDSGIIIDSDEGDSEDPFGSDADGDADGDTDGDTDGDGDTEINIETDSVEDTDEDSETQNDSDSESESDSIDTESESDSQTDITCEGTAVDGFCWYLGQRGESCTTTCSLHGGYDEATRTYTGSGGTDANCRSVLDVLGAGSGEPLQTNCNPGGMGCLYDPDNQPTRVRCASPTTTAGAFYVNAYRVCACAR